MQLLDAIIGCNSETRIEVKDRRLNEQELRRIEVVLSMCGITIALWLR
jgi:hypothetical protein